MKKITMYRADSLVLNTTIQQNGAPVDITGAKVWFTAKRKVTDADVDAVIQVSSPTHISIDSDQVANRGQCVINVPPTFTSALYEAELSLFFDIQVLFATGRIATVDYGTLLIVPDVTQAIS